MREIKFRGRRKEIYVHRGESLWVYGNFVKHLTSANVITDLTGKDISSYVCKIQVHSNKTLCNKEKKGKYKVAAYVVEEDSVGQYTGFKDENGKEIYEGDIVWLEDEDEYAEILWDSVIGKWAISTSSIQFDFDSNYRFWQRYKNCWKYI